MLVKQFPYTSWILASMSQKSNQHGQEEHYVDNEDTDSIREAPARM